MKQPSLRPVPQGEVYEVTRDFEIEIDDFTVVVPRFFRYDGASIPAIAWQAIHTPFNPLVMGPALVHDWLYYTQQVERETADDIFYKLLKLNGVDSGKRYAMWAAVRMAGELYWDNDEEDIDEMVKLCKKLNKDKDIEKYGFPKEVIERCKTS